MTFKSLREQTMEFFKLFGVQRRQPPKVPTDTVLPLHGWAPPYEVVMEFAFKFDDILDPEALRKSLKRLMELKNWRELGGRLRYNSGAQGKRHELHVPAQFTETRPGFIFRASEWGGSINEHPVASKLPKTSDKLGFMGSPDVLAPFMRRDTDPRHIEDWIYSDLPPLFLYQINFHDASLLLLTFPHYLIDAMGCRTFLRAWMAVLHGREHDVPELCSFADHPYLHLSKRPSPENYVLRNYVVRNLGTLVWVIRLFWERLWHDKEEQTTIMIPGWFIKKLRKETLEILAGDKGKDNVQPPFVSDSDALLAWFMKTYLAALEPTGNRPLVLMNVFDIRSIALDPEVGYLMNAIVPSYTILPISDVLEKPAAFLAARIRASLVEQRTVKQINAYIALQSKTEEKTRMPPMIGTSNMFFTICSNWKKAGFFQLDLSPAVRDSGIQVCRRANGLGVPSLFWNTTPLKSTGQSSGVILGQDSVGNWWMEWFLGLGTRSKLQGQFDALNLKYQDAISGTKIA